MVTTFRTSEAFAGALKFAGKATLVDVYKRQYINFDGTLSSWWTKIAIGILLFIFIALQRGLTVLWENRQSSPVTRAVSYTHLDVYKRQDSVWLM